MKKRSHGQTAYIEKCYTSCLSSLVRNFNSRVSRNSQKLLSDTRHCSHRYLGTSNSRRKLDLPSYTKMVHQDTNDDNGKEAKLDTLGMASIRTLMEEEMSITLNPKVFNGELDRVQSDLELDIYLKRNHHKKSKKHKVETCPQINELKDSSGFDSSLSNSANQTASPSINFDLAAHMVEFYCENYRYQEKQSGSNIEPCSAVEDSDHLNEPDSFCSQKHLSLEKALDDIADIFLCQKFIDPNLTTNEHAQSKEFKDALEKLNSNKELFFKLIQEQKSPLLKHVEELHGVSPENVDRLAAREEPVTRSPSQKQNWNSLFSRKKYKWKERWPSKGSHSSPATSKIVVLKPSPEVNQNASVTESPSSSAQLPQGVKHHKNMERFFSSFSFQKLKKRLRRFIGESRKSKHAMSFDGNGILYGSRHSVDGDTNENNGSASKTPYDTEYKFQPLPIIRKKDEQSKQKELGLPTSGESFRYEDAKKHLAEMLAALDETASLSKKEVSEQLEKPLPSPEYESELLHKDMSFSESREFNQENSMGDSETCSAGNAYETRVMDSTLLCTGGDLMNSKGTSEIFEISDIISTEEQDRSGMLTESNENEPNFESEKCGGEGSCEIFELGASDDKLEIPVSSASISSFLHVKELENLEEILENPEMPGPVSVLEAVLPEDSLSPRSTTVDNHVDFQQQTQKADSEEHGNSAVVLISSGFEGDPKNCLGDKKHILGFVKTLLEASGLSFNETSESGHLSDQLVDPSLFDKLANSFGLLSDDPSLLFDYINEVLAETRERLFGCTPLVSIIKTDIRLILTRNLIGEVCKSIDSHFPEKQFPYIPDELESDIWMDLQLETGDVVMEMTDDILEEIMDKIVLELHI